MALAFDYSNPANIVVTIPQADLTFVAGTLYELDTNAFRLDIAAEQASERGIVFSEAARHNTEVTVAGTTFARTIEMINGWGVTFENLTYSVRLAGSNNNIFDVENGILTQNLVQVIAQNSAGLVNVKVADAVWDALAVDYQSSGTMGAVMQKLLAHAGANKVVKVLTTDANSNPLTQRVRIYDTPANASADDGATGLLAQLTVTSTFLGKALDTFESIE